MHEANGQTPVAEGKERNRPTGWNWQQAGIQTEGTWE